MICFKKLNKYNEILYSVPYQHFTNAIENWFSVLKSRLQKKEGLTYNYLQRNIAIVLRDIQLTTFNNIFKGVYERPEKYKPKKGCKTTVKFKVTAWDTSHVRVSGILLSRNRFWKPENKTRKKKKTIYKVGVLNF